MTMEMTMAGHFRKVCPHGQVVEQCRCPGPKADMTVPCPFPEHESAGQSPVSEVAGETGAADRRLTEELGHYIAGVNRYARDAYFHARVKRIQQLMRIAEPSMVEAASTGALWGVVTALHLVDIGAEEAVPPVGEPNATRYGCAFRGCGWTLETSLDAFAGDFIENFELYPSPRVLRRLHDGAVDKALRAHLLDEHRDVIETLGKLLPGATQ